MSTNTPPSAGRAGGKYLSFALGNEEYGVPILRVREIVGCLDITAVPMAAAHVRGVVNLRGQVIPVIDLRSRLGMTPAARTDETCIVVIETVRQGRKVCQGIVVDRVREVLNIPAEHIEEPPEIGDDSDFILGMGKVGSNVKILLDLDRVLADATSAIAA